MMEPRVVGNVEERHKKNYDVIYMYPLHAINVFIMYREPVLSKTKIITEKRTYIRTSISFRRSLKGQESRKIYSKY